MSPNSKNQNEAIELLEEAVPGSTFSLFLWDGEAIYGFGQHGSVADPVDTHLQLLAIHLLVLSDRVDEDMETVIQEAQERAKNMGQGGGVYVDFSE